MQDVNVSDRVMLYRIDRDWSQGELARRSGLSSATISLIESGKQTHPRRITLMRLARAFGVDLDEFLSDRPPKESSPSLPEQVLLEGGLNHGHLIRSFADLMGDAAEMSIPEIIVTINEINEETDTLVAARQRVSDYLRPEERQGIDAAKVAREELRRVTKGRALRVAALAEIAEEKQRRADIPQREKRRYSEELAALQILESGEAHDAQPVV